MSGKKYYLTPNEFSVISAGFGITMVYGLKQLGGKVDNKEICMALHNMYVNRLIENKDSVEFVADDEITEIMRVIKAAKRLVIMEHSADNKNNTICCYHGTMCAVVEENFSNPDKIIIYISDWDKIVRDVLEASADMAVAITLLDAESGRILDKRTIPDGKGRPEKKVLLNGYYEEAGL